MEAMSVDPVLESTSARWPTKESTTAADELGGVERLASTADEPAAVPKATTGTAGSLEVETRIADAMPESRVEKPVMLEE